MKILILSDMKSSGMSGVETHVAHLQDFLKQKGHEADVYAPDGKTTFLSRFLNIPEGFRIARLCRKKGYDVIHFHMVSFIISPFFLLVIPKRIKVLFTMHDYRYYCPKLFGVYKGKICQYGLTWKCMIRQQCMMHTALKNKFLRTAKAVYLTLCNYTHNYFFERWVDYYIIPPKHLLNVMQGIFKGAKGKMVHMPHFVPALKADEIDRSILRPKQFIFVGRLAEEKGVDILIRAVNRLVKDEGLSDIRLKIAGDGPVMANLQQMVVNLGLSENIEFLGATAKDKLDKLYQESIATVIPSAWLENTPNVAYEAMRNARPIIASRLGGFLDLVEHGMNGLLFEMGDSKGLAECMKELYNHPDLSQKMGDHGQKRLAEEFNADIYYAKYEKMLEGTL